MFYKGKEGQWAWIFHRLTGLGVLLFLILHVVDTFLVGFGPDVYNKMIAIYRHPFFKVNEIFLFAAVLYHALNGVRVVLVDLWPGAARHHKRIFYIEMAVFVAAMVPVTVIMVGHLVH